MSTNSHDGSRCLRSVERARGRGTDQDPVGVGVRLIEQGHPQYALLAGVEALKQESVLEILKRRGDPLGTWMRDGAAIDAARPKRIQPSIG